MRLGNRELLREWSFPHGKKQRIRLQKNEKEKREKGEIEEKRMTRMMEESGVAWGFIDCRFTQLSSSNLQSSSCLVPLLTLQAYPARALSLSLCSFCLMDA